MEDIKKAQQRLVNAIVAMHPQLCMGDKKQEELYLAMHDLTSKMAKLNECGGECSNESSGLHLQRVMHRKSFLEERIAYTETKLKEDRNSEEVDSLEYDLYGFKQQLAAIEYVLYGA